MCIVFTFRNLKMWTQIINLCSMLLLVQNLSCWCLPCLDDVQVLKRVFEAPNSNLNDVFYVQYQHIHSVPHNVTRLFVLVEQHQEMNLDFLFRLKNLEETWISYEEESTDCLMQTGVRLLIGKWASNLLNMKRFHLFIRPMTSSDIKYVLWPLFQKMTQLEVLDLTGSYILENNPQTIISNRNIHVNNLKALSLSRTLLPYFTKNLPVMDLRKVLTSFQKSPLQYLDLSYNHLIAVTGSTCGLLPHLRILNLSHNPLQMHMFYLFMAEIFTIHPKVEVIQLEGTVTDTLKCYRYHKQLVTGNNLIKSRRKRHFEPGMILTVAKNCLKQLNITFQQLFLNDSKYCEAIQCTTRKSFSVQKPYDIPCKFFPRIQELMSFVNFSCQYYLNLPLSPNLREVYVGTSHLRFEAFGLYRTLCFAKNNLQVISFNNLVSREWQNPLFQVTGFENLTELALAGSKQLIDLESETMKSFTDLKELNISKTYINTSTPLSITKVGSTLNVLDISNTNLSDDTLSASFVTNATILQTIRLAKNNFKTFHLDFTNTLGLRKVDLEGSKIARFSMDTIESLKATSATRKHRLEIDLSNNLLSCTCEEDSLQTVELIQMAAKFNLDFLESDQYICFGGTYSSTSSFVTQVDLDEVRNKCHPSNLHLILSIISSNVVVLSVSFAVFAGYKFRYRIYTSILRFYWSIQNGNRKLELNFTYDAFISYCAEDRFWVHDTLMKELEDNYGFKLCIHYRDFGFGDIADEILKHILKSRCVVVILSQISLKSHWCDFELKAAHNQSVRNNKKLVIIKFGDIKVSDDTPELVKELLESRVYMEWPEKEIRTKSEKKRSQQVKQLKERKQYFWTRLANVLLERPEGNKWCPCHMFGYKDISNVTQDESDAPVFA